MSPNVVIVATLDTKGRETEYLRHIIREEGCSVTVMDVGTLHPPDIRPDITRDEVVGAGGSTVADLREKNDRRLAVETVIRGAAAIVKELHAQGRLAGIISLGGGTGTHIGTSIMRALPLGVPKLMVSTVASRDMSELIGTKDITMMHSVVDILGLNPISEKILANAAAAIAGMARRSGRIRADKPVIGLTSFGFITEGAVRVKGMLEARGYEVAPFHANGAGGMAMEDLIDQGLINGVLDLALHEFPDEMYGGYCGAIGPERLESAGRRGVPQVVVPGGLDCIVLEFNTPETMPARVMGRKVFWYDFRSGVRTSPDDMIALARTIGDKLNRAKGPTRFVIPLKGWSEADAEGGPLHEPQTNRLFIDELKAMLDNRVQIVEVDAHINDEAFAEAAVSQLEAIMPKQRAR